MSDLELRLRFAADNKELEIGEAWNLLEEAAEAIRRLVDEQECQRNTIQALMQGVEEHTGKEGTTPVLRYICELESRIESLSKCCCQRGARMQIMRNCMDPDDWALLLEGRPEADDWFDDKGMPN